MVMVATDRIGHGDNGLGSRLMISFLNALNEMRNELRRLVFLDNGVKLTTNESPVLTCLKKIGEGRGSYPGLRESDSF